MRKDILTADMSIVNKTKIYRQENWLCYEMKVFEPADYDWYWPMEGLASREPEIFERECLRPFIIATPTQGLMTDGGTVLPWFEPDQKCDLPEFMQRSAAAILDKVCPDQTAIRTVLYGFFDRKQNVFYVRPDVVPSEDILMVFFDRGLGASQRESNRVHRSAHKMGALHYVKLGGVHYVGANKSRKSHLVTEILIANAETADRCLMNATKPRKSLTERLHSEITIYEKLVEVSKRPLKERGPKPVEPIKAKKRPENIIPEIDPEVKERIQLGLKKLGALGVELYRIDPRFGFSIVAAKDWFSVNGNKYCYTKDALLHIAMAIRCKDKPFERMVPFERQRVYMQMCTCLMHLMPYFDEDLTDEQVEKIQNTESDFRRFSMTDKEGITANIV